MFWKDRYWKRWIRKRGCKLGGGLGSLSRRAHLVLEEGVELGHVEVVSSSLAIGAQTYIRSGCRLSFVASIGRFCSIGSDVHIGQERATHPSDWLSSHPFQHVGTGLHYVANEPLAEVGHDVWIGHSAMIMAGVKIGTGAIIATRAVVTRDVPPYAVVAGVPAKVVSYRFPPELIERLLASQWWERPLAELKRLPLNDPQACMESLAGLPESRAAYSRIELTRNGGRQI